MTPADAAHLRRAIALSAEARESGNRPFGALIVDAAGRTLVEVANAQTTGRDCTAHAETAAVRAAWAAAGRDVLGECTLYSSAEPCAMCAAAIFYANIRRVVFGLGEPRLRALRNGAAATAGIAMSCREIFARAAHAVEVIGPVLEDEAARAHDGYWTAGAR